MSAKQTNSQSLREESADEGRFAWESFEFTDDERLRFFAAVESGNHEEAEAICDEADERRFSAVN
jgi:hypothetical protein